MTAFQKIESGISEMDKALNYIRMGDNVVWQIDSLEVFKAFVNPFVNQAIADKRNLIYIRFSEHEPLLEPQPGLKIYALELSHRFETFTVELHNIIRDEGRDAFYVFDCLSDLQVAWSTDLMMGNFFRVTCPFLFELDTVAFFPILRGRHSFDTIAKIRETTQLLFDAFGKDGIIYVQPLKVWNRYLPTMFLPHKYNPEDGSFRPLTDSISVSRFYERLHEIQPTEEMEILDSWDRFFSRAKIRQEEGTLTKRELKFMSDVIMTRDEKLRKLIEKYFKAEDFFFVRSKMIGTGMVGGKACGMLLARKIVETELPEYKSHMEPHDSYFIGSDVFYTYLVENKCWEMRVHQRTEEGYYKAAPKLKEAIENGHFPGNIREEFRRMLSYFAQSPIIVRSSSILEDGFGNAFAGKYESVFCPDIGDLETRLEAFERAVKIVYASTMNYEALEYRMRRGMDKRDEQMALLVQRVSGSYYGKYYMPNAAGVGFSCSTYKFMENMDVTKGMLRLVMGLGTKAVDRTEGDYPRLVSLDMPTAVVNSDSAYRHRFSQHKIDVLDLEESTKKELPFEDIITLLPGFVMRNLLSHDFETERMFRERGQRRDILYISCDGLTRNSDFTSMLENILHTLQTVYDYPVDIEYTVNIGENNDFVMNLLQCRPLQTWQDSQTIDIPVYKDNTKVLFDIKHTAMGQSRKENIDVIVFVDPHLYYNYSYNKKPAVAKQIGEINQYYKKSGKNMILITPGRIGTSSPELGVPVTFAEISEFDIICETAYSKAGYMPELSYGSHMFQDLVESDILYIAIMENQNTIIFNPDYLTQNFHNRLSEICHDAEELTKMIGVYELENCVLYHDFKEEQTLCVFGEKEKA